MDHTEQIQEWMRESAKYLKSVFPPKYETDLHFSVGIYDGNDPTCWVYLYRKDMAVEYGYGLTITEAVQKLQNKLRAKQKDIWDLL